MRIAPQRSSRLERRRRLTSPGSSFDGLQRLVDRGDREVRVDEATVAVVDGAVGEDEQLGAVADELDGLLLEALDRALGGLGLEQAMSSTALRWPAELLPEVLEQVGLVVAGDPAQRLGAERRHLVVAAEDDREAQLDGRGLSPSAAVGAGALAEDGAAGEVLDLALAVDRRVGDDGDRLLEVVGEVLALGRERGQRAVVAERADRLGAVGGHLLDELHVVALPAEAGEHAVGDLDGLGGAGVRVAGDVGALERAAGQERRVVARELVDAGALAASAAECACAGSRRAVQQARVLAGVDRSRTIFSPGANGFGSETIVGDGATPGSELKTKSSTVSTCQSGRRPSASVQNTHSFSSRPISATGPCANGPITWRRYM